MISPVQIGWKKLKGILNDVIIKNLNLQKPLKGDGILLNETASGTIISAVKKDDSKEQKDTTVIPDADLIDPDGATADWQKIQVLSGDSIYDMWVWGTPPTNPQPCTSLSSSS